MVKLEAKTVSAYTNVTVHKDLWGLKVKSVLKQMKR